MRGLVNGGGREECAVVEDVMVALVDAGMLTACVTALGVVLNGMMGWWETHDHVCWWCHQERGNG